VEDPLKDDLLRLRELIENAKRDPVTSGSYRVAELNSEGLYILSKIERELDRLQRAERGRSRPKPPRPTTDRW
jgi:hypothetical protein